ncbi:hypothetical protein [Pelagibacterium sp. H642]|uniref:hypothetical protein n=1 Tax=Pelagibacterium sp. H642 TaxID=1881069 RepID=UPI0028150E63|nr:hypothetical protein [Pelagibacterium sp. H642]WMT92002.1 hypothetical protein NO934_07025 [Pelagibacterium sp. H642]
MEGGQEGLYASNLAKKLAAAPADEMPPLMETAALKPKLFRALFDTFHGDTVTKAKLRQRASDLNVHPEKLELAVDTYIATLLTADLAAVDDDRVTHKSAAHINAQESSETEPNNNDTGGLLPDTNGTSPQVDIPLLDDTPHSSRARAQVNISISIDSTMDSEKLQKQLELLKKYGAI